MPASEKPRPEAMDEWTHFLHGPDNNPVADDKLVGPPGRRMQLDTVDALAGKLGGMVLQVDPSSGDELSRLEIDTIPVYDGMSAANGMVFMPLIDGTVMCLGE